MKKRTAAVVAAIGAAAFAAGVWQFSPRLAWAVVGAAAVAVAAVLVDLDDKPDGRKLGRR